MKASEAKWTPGKRTIHERREFPAGIIVEVRDEDGACIATFVYRGDEPEGIEATRADAALDAAGPAMYVALLKLTEGGRHRLIDCEVGLNPECVCGLTAGLKAIAASDSVAPKLPDGVRRR